VLKLVAITTDCDQDSLLIAADPVGPTCHLGNPSCFDGHPVPPLGFLAELEQILASRKGRIRPPATPPASMAKAPSASPRRWVKRGGSGPGRHGERREELINESADLLYHLTVCCKTKAWV
jgi:phosphoribosyl-ATP pyrophosphohydrolase/phosphoribosyl-AMP cyclohydrolase